MRWQLGVLGFQRIFYWEPSRRGSHVLFGVPVNSLSVTDAQSTA